jgi:hypothetical protein
METEVNSIFIHISLANRVKVRDYVYFRPRFQKQSRGVTACNVAKTSHWLPSNVRNRE